MKSSTPASAAMAAAVSGLSPVIITVLMPILRKLREAFLDAAFDDVFEMDRRRATSCPSATTSGVPPRREISSTVLRRPAAGNMSAR